MKQKFLYQKLNLKQVACPVCNGNYFQPLACTDRYRMGIKTVGCNTCGLLMTNPQPTEEDLAEFYSNYYRCFYQKIESPSLEYIKKFKKNDRAIHTANYLEHNGLLNRELRLLDVGCSEGSMLKEIRNRKPKAVVEGIEPNINFATFTKEYVSCTVHESLAKVLALKDKKYDLITLTHVLEHASNPRQLLTLLTSKLNEGGSIYVDVPSVSDYKGVEALHLAHLYHFSCKSLTSVAMAAQLEVEQMERYQPIMHPESIRCFLRKSNKLEKKSITKSKEDDYDWQIITKIQINAWKYFIKRNGVIKSISKIRFLLNN